MKPLFVIIILALVTCDIGAQTPGRANQQKPRSSVKPSPTSRSAVKPVPGSSVKDRIDRRFRDSAAAANTAGQPSATTVVNGIRVTEPATGSNAVGNPPNTPATAFRDTGMRPVSGGSSSTAYPGNVLQPAGTGVNNSTTGNRPVTGEQSQYNTTDLNRNQMNVINQNQNASSPQNNTVAGRNGNIVGESQWGQNQVGENQWTPPPAVITTGFGRDFPAIRNATWSMDNNRNYIARYKNGDWWATSSYNMAGIRLETRTEVPVTVTLPSPVLIYKERQVSPIDFNRISRVERPGKEEVYEVRLSSGRLIYLDRTGAEVTF